MDAFQTVYCALGCPPTQRPGGNKGVTCSCAGKRVNFISWPLSYDIGQGYREVIISVTQQGSQEPHPILCKSCIVSLMFPC